jgi:hypothetical protein
MPVAGALETNRQQLLQRALADFPRIKPRAGRLARGLARDMRYLLSRLRADSGALSAALHATGNLSVIDELALLGDPHGAGGRVTRLTLVASDSSVHHVVYKPRSIDVDDAFYTLSKQLAEQDDERVLRPWMLRRLRHGWMQHISPSDCAKRADVNVYYSRLGWLTAIVHALSGQDCHAGNIIAHGDHPVLVDLECLLTSSPAPAAPALVTATGIIPMVRFAVGDFPGMDVSGFSGGNNDRHFYSDWRIVLNAAGVPQVQRQPATAARGFNVPTVNGERVNPFDFSESFVGGFRKGYQCLLRARPQLTAPDGWLMAFAGVQTRVVIRNTGEYVKAITESTAPLLLLSQASEINHYHRCLGARIPNAVEKEVHRLRNGWIPRFEAMPDLTDNGGMLDRIGESGGSGLDQVRRFVTSQLSERDMEHQVQLIQHCVGAMALNQNEYRSDTAPILPAASTLNVLKSVIAHLEEGHRPTSESDWLSCESSRAGTLVAARAHWGSFTGKAGIVGTYLHLDRHGMLGTASSTMRRALAHLSDHSDSAHTLSVGGVNGRASLVLLDALARRNGYRHLMALGQQSLRDIAVGPTVVRTGLNGTAGTMLVLAAAHHVNPASDVESALHQLLDNAVGTAVFQKLEDAIRSQASVEVSWGIAWTLLLAVARTANTIGRTEVVRRCTAITSHPGLIAHTTQNRLLRALLLLECRSSMADAIVRLEIDSLTTELMEASLASQYGSGALVGLMCRLAERDTAHLQNHDRFLTRYVCRVATITLREHLRTSARCVFYDAARGMAGVALRLLNLHVRTAIPATIIF